MEAEIENVKIILTMVITPESVKVLGGNIRKWDKSQ